MQYKTSEVTTFSGKERDADEYLDYFTLEVSLDGDVHKLLVRLDG